MKRFLQILRSTQLFQEIAVIRISEKLNKKYSGEVQFESNYLVLPGKSTTYVFCWKHFMDICPNVLKRIVDESILPLPWDILDLSTEINRKEVTHVLKKSCNLFFKF